MARLICDIASEIRSDWKRINYGALPYLDAMDSIESVHEYHGMDSAKSIVTYFLLNATAWRGETARRIKLELNNMIKQNL